MLDEAKGLYTAAVEAGERALGDNNEAIAYAVDYKAIWADTPGVLDWLKSNLEKQPW